MTLVREGRRFGIETGERLARRRGGAIFEPTENRRAFFALLFPWFEHWPLSVNPGNLVQNEFRERTACRMAQDLRYS